VISQHALPEVVVTSALRPLASARLNTADRPQAGLTPPSGLRKFWEKTSKPDYS